MTSTISIDDVMWYQPPPPPPDKIAAISETTFSNEKFYILIKISLRFVPNGPINNILAGSDNGRSGDKPLSEPMLTQFTDAYVWH